MAAQRGKKPSTRKKLTTGDKLPVSDSLPLFFARMLANDLSFNKIRQYKFGGSHRFELVSLD